MDVPTVMSPSGLWIPGLDLLSFLDDNSDGWIFMHKKKKKKTIIIIVGLCEFHPYYLNCNILFPHLEKKHGRASFLFAPAPMHVNKMIVGAISKFVIYQWKQ